MAKKQGKKGKNGKKGNEKVTKREIKKEIRKGTKKIDNYTLQVIKKWKKCNKPILSEAFSLIKANKINKTLIKKECKAKKKKFINEGVYFNPKSKKELILIIYKTYLTEDIKIKKKSKAAIKKYNKSIHTHHYNLRKIQKNGKMDEIINNLKQKQITRKKIKKKNSKRYFLGKNEITKNLEEIKQNLQNNNNIANDILKKEKNERNERKTTSTKKYEHESTTYESEEKSSNKKSRKKLTPIKKLTFTEQSGETFDYYLYKENDVYRNVSEIRESILKVKLLEMDFDVDSDEEQIKSESKKIVRDIKEVLQYINNKKMNFFQKGLSRPMLFQK